eukprot:scaffold122043_cov44-Attheya_sp.AAC.1
MVSTQNHQSRTDGTEFRSGARYLFVLSDTSSNMHLCEITLLTQIGGARGLQTTVAGLRGVQTKQTTGVDGRGSQDRRVRARGSIPGILGQLIASRD